MDSTVGGASFVNSTTGSYDYALQLFADHKGLFYKQGSWIYLDLKKANPQVINRLDMIPIKMPFTQSDIRVRGRTPETFNTSIPFFVPNYWVINQKVGVRQQEEAARFLVWLYTSEGGKRFLEDEAGFITYNRIAEDQANPTNAMNAILLDYLKEGRTLSNPCNAAPGNWLEFAGNRLKQDYMTKIPLGFIHLPRVCRQYYRTLAGIERYSIQLSASHKSCEKPSSRSLRSTSLLLLRNC